MEVFAEGSSGAVKKAIGSASCCAAARRRMLKDDRPVPCASWLLPLRQVPQPAAAHAAPVCRSAARLLPRHCVFTRRAPQPNEHDQPEPRRDESDRQAL